LAPIFVLGIWQMMWLGNKTSNVLYWRGEAKTYTCLSAGREVRQGSNPNTKGFYFLKNWIWVAWILVF